MRGWEIRKRCNGFLEGEKRSRSTSADFRLELARFSKAKLFRDPSGEKSWLEQENRGVSSCQAQLRTTSRQPPCFTTFETTISHFARGSPVLSYIGSILSLVHSTSVSRSHLSLSSVMNSQTSHCYFEKVWTGIFDVILRVLLPALLESWSFHFFPSLPCRIIFGIILLSSTSEFPIFILNNSRWGTTFNRR